MIPDELRLIKVREADSRMDFSARYGGSKDAKGGGRVGWGASIYPKYLGRGRHLGSDFHIHYPDLSVGDVVPALGHVFVVAEFGAWRKLKGEKIPRGAAAAADAFAVPLAKDGRGSVNLHDNHCEVEAIKGESRGEKAYADISVQPLSDDAGRSMGGVRARVGDMVLFGRAAHKIRTIVPPDAKTRVIGWVEIDPDPVKEDALIKGKIPFLRPAKERALKPTVEAKGRP